MLRMKRNILFSLIIFVSGYLSAQEIVFEQTFGKESLVNDVKAFVHTVQASADGSLFSHLLFRTKTNIKHQYKTSDGRYKEINVPLLDEESNDTTTEDSRRKPGLMNHYKRSDYILHVVSNDKVIDVLYNPKTFAYYFVATLPKTGEITIEDTVFVKYNANLIDCYYEDSTIFMLHYFPDENQIKISQKKLGAEISNRKVFFPSPVKRNQLQEKEFLDGTSNKLIYHVYERNLWMPPYSLNYNILSYRKKDELQVVFNDKEHNTWIVTVNITSGNISTKKYECPAEIQDNRKGKITGWIADSTLIRGYTATDKIFLFFNKLGDADYYKSIVLTEANHDSLASTQVNKTGNFWSRSNFSVSDFSVFLKKAKNNKLLITGYEENGKLFLTLAVKFDILPNATLLGNLMTLGAMDFRQVKPPSYLSFDISLQTESGKTNVGPTKQLVWDKLLMSIYANRNNVLVNISYQKDNYYLAFVNIETRKLTVYRYHKYL